MTDSVFTILFMASCLCVFRSKWYRFIIIMTVKPWNCFWLCLRAMKNPTVGSSEIQPLLMYDHCVGQSAFDILWSLGTPLSSSMPGSVGNRHRVRKQQKSKIYNFQVSFLQKARKGSLEDILDSIMFSNQWGVNAIFSGLELIESYHVPIPGTSDTVELTLSSLFDNGHWHVDKGGWKKFEKPLDMRPVVYQEGCLEQVSPGSRMERHKGDFTWGPSKMAS